MHGSNFETSRILAYFSYALVGLASTATRCQDTHCAPAQGMSASASLSGAFFSAHQPRRGYVNKKLTLCGLKIYTFPNDQELPPPRPEGAVQRGKFTHDQSQLGKALPDDPGHPECVGETAKHGYFRTAVSHASGQSDTILGAGDGQLAHHVSMGRWGHRS
jgi:hypothetical protein